MLVVADINTLWRRKPFEAVAALCPVLGLAPQDVLTRWRNGRSKDVNAAGALQRSVITLPPGWASRFADFTGWYLWLRAWQEAKQTGRGIRGVVVTSPHYLALVKRIGGQVPTYYYCSDDYAEYFGWGGSAMLKQEELLVKSVTHCFFVSRLLAERAVESYGLARDRASVSPNATDDRFFQPASAAKIETLLHAFPALRRPLVGVVGGINGRLDFDLIAACASMPEVGSLVMVGPVDADCTDAGLARLRGHPKCVFAGAQPHDDLPAWMQALDVALIPYRDTALNRACSPMRLFDHLASGRPVVATEANEQVRGFDSVVRTGRSVQEVCAQMRAVLGEPEPMRPTSAQKALALEQTWRRRAEHLCRTMAPSMGEAPE